jgi:serine/threonine-protein kinase
MAPVRAIEVLCGVAGALDHAHQHGVVHRDVKPANVLIARRDGTVKLTDFGIATAAEQSNITGSGVVLGTAAYLAPERLDGNPGGPESDVYATAAVAFEMLSGRKAVTGKTAMEVARRVIEAPPPDLAELVPGTPRRAAEVLMRGMAKDPSQRPATVGELVRELSAAYAEEARPAPVAAPTPAPRPAPRARPAAAATAPVAAATPARADRPRRRGWLVPALLAVAAAVVLAIVLLAGGGDDGSKQAQNAKPKATKRDRSRNPTAAAPATPAAPAPATPPASSSGDSAPAKALTDFYTRAANDDFQGAWALGTDNLHAQFNGSFGTFKGTFATLQSIRFPTLKTTSQTATAATVELTSIATHTNRTDRCSGQAKLVRGAGGWLVDHIGVNCTS